MHRPKNSRTRVSSDKTSTEIGNWHVEEDAREGVMRVSAVPHGWLCVAASCVVTGLIGSSMIWAAVPRAHLPAGLELHENLLGLGFLFLFLVLAGVTLCNADDINLYTIDKGKGRITRVRRHECFTRLAVHVIDLQGVRRASVQRREADDPAISEGKYEYRVALCIVEGEVEAAEDSGLRGYVGDSGYFEVPLQLRWTFGKKSESDALSLALVLNTFMGVRTTDGTGSLAQLSPPSAHLSPGSRGTAGIGYRQDDADTIALLCNPEVRVV